MTQLYRFLGDTSNDSMLIKGAVGLWAWIMAQADQFTSWDMWEQWYGVVAQVGAGCVGVMMFLVLWSNFYKNVVETRNLKRTETRTDAEWQHNMNAREKLEQEQERLDEIRRKQREEKARLQRLQDGVAQPPEQEDNPADGDSL